MVDKWQAEMDASTLAEAGEIKKDSPRLKAATKLAGVMADAAQIRATELKKVAKEGQPVGRRKSGRAKKPANPLLKGLT